VEDLLTAFMIPKNIDVNNVRVQEYAVTIELNMSVKTVRGREYVSMIK
jgi:hypothetical protein